jgi:VIT1/CCC1 family predicted Fe2+/Mn2+ transporter
MDNNRYLREWQREVNRTARYRALAELEADSELAPLYERLAETEQRHIDYWAKKIAAEGGTVPAPEPDRRTKTLISLAQRFGPQVLEATADLEERGPDGTGMRPAGRPDAGQPRHTGMVQEVLEQAPGGVSGPTIARLEGRRHQAAGSGNALRAAVLGANDGLLSNFSLIMGVAGASLDNTAILISGLSGLLAGAGSMAMGEWISVQSSRELYEQQIAVERREHEEHPEEEEAELAEIYEAKGLAPDAAKAIAKELIADPTSALDTLAREELGIDPDQLGGSAIQAAGTSFVLFSLGAIIPVLPYIFSSGTPATMVSVVLSILGLFGIGAAITVVTGRSIWYSGFRQVIIGALAAGLTYAVGRLLGTTIV